MKDQRYALPEGWLWAQIEDTVQPVGQFNPAATPQATYRYVDVSSISNRFFKIEAPKIVTGAEAPTRARQAIRPCDVLFSTVRPYLRNVAMLRNEDEGNVGSTAFCVLRSNGCVDPGYLFRWTLTKEFFEGLLPKQRGISYPAVRDGDVLEQLIPLAPLPEQRRIAAKVEALFEQSRTARQALDRIPPLLKKFRQSVLAAAFRGDLTRDWREAHSELDAAASLLSTDSSAKGKAKKRAGRLWGAGVVPGLTEQERLSLPGPWAWTKVRNLGENPEETVQVGPMSMRSREFTDSGIPVLNVGCVNWGHLDETKLDHLPPHIAAKFGRYRVAKDDILFTRSGTVGRCAIATERHEGYLMTFHLLRVRVSRRKCLPEYLQLVFQGAPSIHRQTDEAAIGSTRAGFNTNLLADLDVPLPQQIEQHEIVNRVKRLFKLADAIETTVKMAQRRAEILEQSILSQAFRGELVPQDPSDEPAAILADRAKERAVKRVPASSKERRLNV